MKRFHWDWRLNWSVAWQIVCWMMCQLTCICIYIPWQAGESGVRGSMLMCFETINKNRNDSWTWPSCPSFHSRGSMKHGYIYIYYIPPLTSKVMRYPHKAFVAWGFFGSKKIMATPSMPFVMPRVSGKDSTNFMSYCWWKKSCTSWYGEYPIIYRLLKIPSGAGFFPSTAGFSIWDDLLKMMSKYHPLRPKRKRTTSWWFQLSSIFTPKIGDASFFKKTGRKKTSNYQERSSLKTLDVSIFFRCFFSSAGYFWKRTRHQVIQFVTFWPPSWRSRTTEEPLKWSLNHPKKSHKDLSGNWKLFFFQWGNPEFLVATIAHAMHPKFSRWGSSDPP